MLKLIKDPVFGNIVLSRIEAGILETPIFNRLHHLMQNGLAYRVFPSNTTTRFEHSIGVMHLAGDMYCRGLANAFPETRKRFLERVWRAMFAPVSKAQSKKDPLLSDPRALSERIEALLGAEFLNHHHGMGGCCFDAGLQAAHAMVLQAIRLAGLLHDVGHLPGSHLFEDAIRLLGNHGIPKKLQKYLDKIESATLSLAPQMRHAAVHEKAGLFIARAILTQQATAMSREDNNSKELVVRVSQAVLRILSWKKHQSHPDGVTDALARLVAGDLDADRLDFVLRDGGRTGLVAASGDVDRIRKMMCLVETGQGFRFCPATQTLNDVQQCLLDRLRLYQYLYSHHRVWRLENMLKWSIRKILNQSGELQEELIAMFADIESLAAATHQAESALERMVRRTDHWLLDLVRQAYDTIFQQEERDHIQELFSGAKTWCGLWKREFEYREFLIRAAHRWLQQDPKLIRRLRRLYHANADQQEFKPSTDPRRDLQKLTALMNRAPADMDDTTLAWLGSIGVRVALSLAEPLLVCRHGLGDAMVCPTRYHPGVHHLCMVDLKSSQRTGKPFKDLSVSMRYFERVWERGIALHVFVRKTRDPSAVIDLLVNTLLKILRTVCRNHPAPPKNQVPAPAGPQPEALNEGLE